MRTYLETERLVLRPFTADDADLLIELDSDPAVMRYLTGGAPTPPDEVRERVLPSVLGVYERTGGRFGVMAACEKATGEFVGWLLLRPERGGPEDEVELGYRLRQAAWGKGYATEGSRELLRKAFTELGVTRVWADTMAVNTGSRHVMEKLGMPFAGTIPVPESMLAVEGSEHGGVRHEITREQWQRQQPDDPRDIPGAGATTARAT